MLFLDVLFDGDCVRFHGSLCLLSINTALLSQVLQILNGVHFQLREDHCGWNAPLTRNENFENAPNSGGV
eukprot:Skav204630  [mRNA]  locus=scaffold1712:304892:308506:+ [translate_table: standard]